MQTPATKHTDSMLTETIKLLDALPSWQRHVANNIYGALQRHLLTGEAMNSLTLAAAMRDLADNDVPALIRMSQDQPENTVKLLGYADAHSRAIIGAWLRTAPGIVRNLSNPLGIGGTTRSRINALFRLSHQSTI